MTATQDYLTARTEDAERYLAWLEDMYAGLRDGTYSWSDWCPEYTCPDRQETAIDECGSAMDAARKDLAALQAQANGTALGSAGDGE